MIPKPCSAVYRGFVMKSTFIFDYAEYYGLIKILQSDLV